MEPADSRPTQAAIAIFSAMKSCLSFALTGARRPSLIVMATNSEWRETGILDISSEAMMSLPFVGMRGRCARPHPALNPCRETVPAGFQRRPNLDTLIPITVFASARGRSRCRAAPGDVDYRSASLGQVPLSRFASTGIKAFDIERHGWGLPGISASAWRAEAKIAKSRDDCLDQ